MHEGLPIGVVASNFPGDRIVIESSGPSRPSTFDDIFVSNEADADEDWFALLAQSLLGPKAGTQLHYITGFDERSCQRYAAGTVKPPGYFLRALLRSEQGASFFAALMEGCDAGWWRDLQRAKRIALQLDKLDLR